MDAATEPERVWGKLSRRSCAPVQSSTASDAAMGGGTGRDRLFRRSPLLMLPCCHGRHARWTSRVTVPVPLRKIALPAYAIPCSSFHGFAGEAPVREFAAVAGSYPRLESPKSHASTNLLDLASSQHMSDSGVCEQPVVPTHGSCRDAEWGRSQLGLRR
jgi:hypothetical protein